MSGAGAAALRWAEALLRALCVGLAALAALAGAAIVALLGASVVMRHVAGAPFRFTEELVGLLVTAAFFLALPLVTLKGEHVRVRLLVAGLPPGPARAVRVAAGCLGVGFCVWIVHLCWPWFTFAFDRGIKTEVARLILYPWMALMPLSLGLTAVAFALRAFGEDPAAPPEAERA